MEIGSILDLECTQTNKCIINSLVVEREEDSIRLVLAATILFTDMKNHATPRKNG